MYNRISYSPMHGKRFFQLYDDAEHARHTDLGTYRQPEVPLPLEGPDTWRKSTLMASGNFTGSGYSDAIVADADGSVTLYQAARKREPKYPFSAEHQIAGAGSVWKYARAITGGSLTGSGGDGLVVRWVDGEVTEYAHVDQDGFHGEKTLFPQRQDNPYWKNARLITVGDFTGDGRRDDLLTLWENGSVSMYSDIDDKGLQGWAQLRNADENWTQAAQIGSGEFTGKKTDDLLISWNNGKTTLFPGLDTQGFHGFHGSTDIRPVGSAWRNAQLLTVGAFAADERPDDILVRWNAGDLSYYPGVDGAGTHGEIQLVG